MTMQPTPVAVLGTLAELHCEPILYATHRAVAAAIEVVYGS